MAASIRYDFRVKPTLAEAAKALAEINARPPPDGVTCRDCGEFVPMATWNRRSDDGQFMWFICYRCRA